jgi:CubicO group peptidase (beta-lactamase class C family)
MQDSFQPVEGAMFKTPRFFNLSLILLIAVSLYTMPARSGATQSASGDFAGVEHYVQAVMAALPIPGMAVAVVRGDQMVYLQGFGTANRAGDPVTPQTPFPLASVTKSFTSLAVQQLAAAGKLNLDASLQTYLPEFQLADSQAAAAITLRHLMAHTSAISQSEGTQPYLHDPATTLPAALAKLAKYQPAYRPGEKYDYSNWNFILLGEVVARASGQPYAQYVQAQILNPLGMKNSTFADYHTIPGAATGNYISFGLPVPYDEKHVPVELSAGYLTASVEDMAHYLIPYFNKGQYAGTRLLPDRGPGSFDANWNWQPGAPPDVAYTYSGGHNSISTGFQVLPAQQLGVIVLMNTRLDMFAPGPAATDLALDIARIVMRSFSPPAPTTGFYVGFAIIDGVLLLLVVSILWQLNRLIRSRGKPGRMAWIGIVGNVLVVGIIALVPGLIGSDWAFMLAYRTDVTLAFLITALLLLAIAIAKTYFTFAIRKI